MSCGNVVKVRNKGNVLEDISVNYLGCGVYVKQVLLQKGLIVESHKHTYDHLAVLQYGKVELIVDGIWRTLVGPTSIEIAAGKVHTVHALEETMWLCVHRIESNEKDFNKLNAALVEDGAE